MCGSMSIWDSCGKRGICLGTESETKQVRKKRRSSYYFDNEGVYWVSSDSQFQVREGISWEKVKQ